MSTFSCFALLALRMRVSISAIGSVIIDSNPLCGYQLALITPGISPLSALFLKQILHISNFLRYPRDRPHNGQR
jgi:hypothetical protein